MPDPPPASAETQIAQPSEPSHRDLVAPGNDSAEDQSLQLLATSPSLSGAPRVLSLREAIQISLANSDVVRTLEGGAVRIADATRFDPMIAQLRSDAVGAMFDPRLTLSYVGSRIDEPPNSFFGPGISQSTRRDEGDFLAELSKSWSTGASTTIGYLPPLGYLYLPNGNGNDFNPIYSSAVVFEARQPLLRGAGLTTNLAPLQITQLKSEQSAWECKQTTLAQVRSVEEAYWDLQASLVTLEAVDRVLPLVEEVVRIEELRFRTERAIRADVARARVQQEQYRQNLLQVQNNAIEKELRLRHLLGLDLVDGSRLVPMDAPSRTQFVLDQAQAVANALENRPDLVRQRLGVRIRELEYAVARNGVRPQLDLRALYRSGGVGQQLNDSLDQMTDFQYSDWTLGLSFSVPLGNRAAKAQRQVAELQLVRERALMQQSIQSISFRIADLIREAQVLFGLYERAVRRAEESQEWLSAARLRYANPPAAGSTQDWLVLALYDYQLALRQQIDATADVASNLSRYNSQLARLEEAQGILLDNRGISLDQDPCDATRRHPNCLADAGSLRPDQVFPHEAASGMSTALPSQVMRQPLPAEGRAIDQVQYTEQSGPPAIQDYRRGPASTVSTVPTTPLPQAGHSVGNNPRRDFGSSRPASWPRYDSVPWPHSTGVPSRDRYQR